MAESSKKIAVVTGASKGAGKGIAKVLAKNDVTVVLVARDQTTLDTLATEIEGEGGSAVAIAADTSNLTSVVSMAKKVIDQVGVPDYIINCAGCWYIQEFCNLDYDSWDNMIDVNIKGYLYVIAEFLPDMKKRKSGHIINISSCAERNPIKGLTVYSGTKVFWAGATNSLRQELMGTGVRITSIQPGMILTEGLTTSFTREEDKAALKKFGMGNSEDFLALEGKMLTPEDIGNCVWDTLSKSSNCYVHDIQLIDGVMC